MAVMEAAVRYRWVALGVAFSSQLGNTMIVQMTAPLAPLLQADLGLSKAEVGLFASAVFIGAWVVLLPAGMLTDRFGGRKMMFLGQLAAGGFLLLMVRAGSFVEAMVVMLGCSLGRGWVNPGGTKAIMDWFPASSRATAMGVKQTGFPIAGIITATALPAIGLLYGWRVAITLVGAWSIAAGVVTLAFYRDRRDTGPVVARKEKDRETLGSLLRNRHLWMASLIAIVFVAAQNSIVTYLVLYLNDVVLVPWVPDDRTRLVVAGGYLALLQVGGAFGRIAWGLVSDRLFQGRRLVVLVIIGGIAAVMTPLVGFLGIGMPPWLLTLAIFLWGTTAAGYAGLYQTLVTETVGRRSVGTGVGASMTMSQIGNVAGPPLFGYVVDVTGSYEPAWLMLTAFSVIGVLIAYLGSRREIPKD